MNKAEAEAQAKDDHELQVRKEGIARRKRAYRKEFIDRIRAVDPEVASYYEELAREA